MTDVYCPQNGINLCIAGRCAWYIEAERGCAVAVQAKALRFIALAKKGEMPKKPVIINEDTGRPDMTPPSKIVRMAQCVRCGVSFEIASTGRPPKMCPGCKAADKGEK